MPEQPDPGASAGGDETSPYRGDSSEYDDEVYPRSYRTPGRINLKKAMREYVQAHDRGWTQEKKARVAEESLDSEAGGEEGYLGPGQAVASGQVTLRIGGEASAADAAGAGGSGEGDRLRFGVGVPERLQFHRGADTWRDRVRELIHGAVEEPPEDPTN